MCVWGRKLSWPNYIQVGRIVSQAAENQTVSGLDELRSNRVTLCQLSNESFVVVGPALKCKQNKTKFTSLQKPPNLLSASMLAPLRLCQHARTEATVFARSRCRCLAPSDSDVDRKASFEAD